MPASRPNDWTIVQYTEPGMPSFTASVQSLAVVGGVGFVGGTGTCPPALRWFRVFTSHWRLRIMNGPGHAVCEYCWCHAMKNSFCVTPGLLSAKPLRGLCDSCQSSVLMSVSSVGLPI